jgi:hypothetical protein
LSFAGNFDRKLAPQSTVRAGFSSEECCCRNRIDMEGENIFLFVPNLIGNLKNLLANYSLRTLPTFCGVFLDLCLAFFVKERKNEYLFTKFDLGSVDLFAKLPRARKQNY